MIPLEDILHDFGFPENPVGILQRLEATGQSSPRKMRGMLVAIQMLLQDGNMAFHPMAWQGYLAQSSLPPRLLEQSPPSPAGWPLPVFLQRAGCGGVVHAVFEEGGLGHSGHRLDFAAFMEVFLGFCSEAGERAFPDSHRFPFAARIRPEVRLDGRSWELPCLIGYFAMHSGKPIEPVFATGFLDMGSIHPGERMEQKIQGWLREVGPGTRALILPDQEPVLARFRDKFGDVRIVVDLADVLSYLRENGWLEAHCKPLDRLGCERLLRAGKQWYKSGRPRMALLTMEALKRNRNVLSSRQEAVWLDSMHYLLSCFGRFDEGMKYLEEFTEKLRLEPHILTGDEKVTYAAKAAVQLYDAHRFKEAEELLCPLMKDRALMKAVSPISRAKLLGSLGQVLTAGGKLEKAEKILEEAVQVFRERDPLEVSRAYHYLIHNRLRAGDVEKAQRLLDSARQWLEETDTYGALFRSFYERELSRLLGRPCERPHLKENYSGFTHPYCFALQAWARNAAHPLEEREKAVAEAAKCLEKVGQAGGVLQFLALTYALFEAYLSGDEQLVRSSWGKWAQWVREKGGAPFEERYRDFLKDPPQEASVLESLMTAIPYH